MRATKPQDAVRRKKRRRPSNFIPRNTPVAGMATVLMTLLLQLMPVAKGHGYLATPRSRNLVAYEETNWARQSPNDPQPETCPQCLNKGGSLARCGMTGGRNYDTPRNSVGGPMKPNVQATYSQGQEVVLDVTLTAHHKGHFVFSACPINPGEVPTQECFDRNQLTFVADMMHGANRDRNYPERAYIAPPPPAEDDKARGRKPGNKQGLGPNSYYSFKMKLPSDVSGDLVLIQWYYLTANSCIHPGYKEYDWPKEWNYEYNTGMCGKVSEDGSGVPEQFWNCAEVRINRKGSGGGSGGGRGGGPKPKPGGKRPNNGISNNRPSGGRKPGRKPGKNKPGRNKKPQGKKKRPDKKKKPGRKKKRRVDRHPRNGRVKPLTSAQQFSGRRNYLREPADLG